MNIYEECGILDAKIKALTDQKDALRVKILEDMIAKGESKVVTTVGTFSVAKIKSWTYPEYVTALNEEYKAAKAKAESTQEATYVESESLKFNAIKL